DPNQGVRGKGYWELQSRGVDVEVFPARMALQIRAMNERFIRFQQTIGAQVLHPAPGQPIDLRQQSDGGWFGSCKLVVKCANDPDPSIKIIMQRGGEWWPARADLHRNGETREWVAEIYFGGDGPHTIHVVRTTDA